MLMLSDENKNYEIDASEIMLCKRVSRKFLSGATTSILGLYFISFTYCTLEMSVSTTCTLGIDKGMAPTTFSLDVCTYTYNVLPVINTVDNKVFGTTKYLPERGGYQKVREFLVFSTTMYMDFSSYRQQCIWILQGF